MIPTISLTRDATGFINRLLSSLLKQDFALWFTAFVDVNLCIFPNLLSQSDVTYTEFTGVTHKFEFFFYRNQSKLGVDFHPQGKQITKCKLQLLNFYIHLQHWLYSYKVQKAQKTEEIARKKGNFSDSHEINPYWWNNFPFLMLM